MPRQRSLPAPLPLVLQAPLMPSQKPSTHIKTFSSSPQRLNRLKRQVVETCTNSLDILEPSKPSRQCTGLYYSLTSFTQFFMTSSSRPAQVVYLKCPVQASSGQS
ncbi:hypothetical protein B0H19DRAFT_1071205 [Mycena capillaripes]|nr:hypothetical protein B0H19DRAFT_1071205 [Mycena capillaripes]